MGLWIVAPKRVKHLARRLSPEGQEWCYFGTNLSCRCEVARILHFAKPVSIAEELDRVAHDTKQPFLDWIAEIGDRQRNKANWWASRLASKSPLQTDFFPFLCYHRLFKSWVADSLRGRARIVVVEDAWLRCLLKRESASDPRVKCIDSPFDMVADGLYWFARVPLAIAYFSLLYSVRKLIAAFVSRGLRKVKEEDRTRTQEILLFMWIQKSSFASAETLNDSCTGRLAELLGKNGETVKRLTFLTVPIQLLWRLRSFAPTLVLLLQYVTFSDIYRSAFSLFRINELRALAKFGGDDYLLLFYREMLREWGATWCATYRLSYLAFRRLATSYGPRLKGLIYPFENQPWEKMLCMAFRNHAPWTRLIGYQHASVPTLLLPYFLGRKEAAYLPLPHVIVGNGKAMLNRLKEGGFPSEILVDGGALRFEYIFQKHRSERSPARLRKSAYRVVVAFPITQVHAAPLLWDLLDLFPTPFVDDQDECQVKLVLKFHPHLPLENIARGAMSLPEWFCVSAQPMSELLDSADLFLYSPPTGTWREAYSVGVPVLKYRGEFLDVDSGQLGSADEIPVCSRDTLREKVYTLLRNGSPSDVLGREDLLQEMFSPVREQVWLDLVSSAGDGRGEE